MGLDNPMADTPTRVRILYRIGKIKHLIEDLIEAAT
jgi:hypothetical protein